jgi:hypothetical protein
VEINIGESYPLATKLFQKSEVDINQLPSVIKDVALETATVRFSVFDDMLSGLDYELTITKEAFIKDMLKILKNTKHFEGITEGKYNALHQDIRSLNDMDRYLKEKGIKIRESIKKANTFSNRISLPFEAMSDNKIYLQEAKANLNLAAEKIKKIQLRIMNELNNKLVLFKNIRQAESFQEYSEMEESLKYEKNKVSILEQISHKERKIFNMVLFRNNTVTVSREVIIILFKALC